MLALSFLVALTRPAAAGDDGLPGAPFVGQVDGLDLVDPVTGTIDLNFNYDAVRTVGRRHPSTPHDLVPVEGVPPPTAAVPLDPGGAARSGGWVTGVAIPVQVVQVPGVVWESGTVVSWRGRPPGELNVYLDGVRMERQGFRGPRR